MSTNTQLLGKNKRQHVNISSIPKSKLASQSRDSGEKLPTTKINVVKFNFLLMACQQPNIYRELNLVRKAELNV
jgi:hypothetical protein